MKIVLLSDDYLPNSTRVHAKMLHELALEFTDRGHEVVVITPGYWQQTEKLIQDFIEGVEVWRFKSRPTRGVGKIKRAINESMLSIQAYSAVREKLNKQKFDICVNYSPTIFFGPLAWYFKIKKTYIYLVLRDFFPQWIIDQGMVKEKSPIVKYFRAFEHLNYRASDCIALQSPANLTLFEKMYPIHTNYRVLMNWTKAKPTSITEVFDKKEFGLDDKVVLFYGGNIGHAQDMMNLIKLAQNLSNHQNAHLLLIGQGDEFELVEQKILSLNLSNVTLLPSVSQEEYIKIVAGVDIGLFSLSSRHTAHNFPGKLLGYMVESLPILGSVNNGNDVLKLVNGSGAGLVSINGEDDIFLANAIELVNNTSLRKSMGKKSFELVNQNFSVESAADDILSQVCAR